MIKVQLNQEQSSLKLDLDSRLIFDIYSLGMIQNPVGIVYEARVSWGMDANEPLRMLKYLQKIYSRVTRFCGIPFNSIELDEVSEKLVIISFVERLNTDSESSLVLRDETALQL